MDKEELIGKLQMVYAGDKNALNELICYYVVLKQRIEIVQQQNQKYKEVIDKATMYINSTKYSDINGLEKHSIKEFWFIEELEKVLKEVE